MRRLVNDSRDVAKVAVSIPPGDSLEVSEALADQLQRRSPLAVASFKAALLDGLGRSEPERIDLEEAAYERCVDTGEAAIGRASFAEIRDGKTPAWGNHRG